MIFRFKDIAKFQVFAKDVQVGKIKDVLFDDLSLVLRYFVVDISGWLPSKKLLVTPDSLMEISHAAKRVTFNQNEDELKEAPPLSSDLPVSRQYEQSLYQYWGLSPYWVAPSAGGAWFPYPEYTYSQNMRNWQLKNLPARWKEILDNRNECFDNHLRSAKEVSGYKITTSDSEKFGEVEDLIFDTDGGILIDMILTSRKWLSGGKQFALSPLFINKINEQEKYLDVALTKQTLINSPEFKIENYGKDYRRSLVEHYLANLSLETTRMKKSQNRTSVGADL